MAVNTDALPVLPRDEDGPVFREPWEAHAFALAVRLSEAGCFTWSEWTTVLSQEIREAQERGDPDLGSTYYSHWLRALEKLCVDREFTNHRDLQERTEQWREAYLHTPHGKPVVLSVANRKQFSLSQRLRSSCQMAVMSAIATPLFVCGFV